MTCPHCEQHVPLTYSALMAHPRECPAEIALERDRWAARLATRYSVRRDGV